MRTLLRWAALSAACVLFAQQQAPQPEPLHLSGQSVTGAFEGWFANPDGTFTILLGYFNRNLKQELDIPAGPDNRVEPGGPDQGQPTHFLPRRHWGVFTITVPRDFQGKKLTWTLRANGVTTVIPAHLDPLWEIAPFRDTNGNTPPWIGFDAGGPFVNGPKGADRSVTVTRANPLPLVLWLADDAHRVPGASRPATPPVTLTWSKFRGPGTVTFANARPPVEPLEFAAPPAAAFRGKAATTATFSEPGEYILHAVANDWTGDGGRGFQCCWSNARVRVSVKE